ncbi:Complex I intermediate-associated protein 30 (CIA30) family protein [Aspergillus niger]|uniref:Complex I intermediate-associated protein 30 (CIA30) family protein n=1 Tax=Aspergillus niger TaxID=5061 RepID=A0A505IF37_ASPNG|nr:Complex I intermediate-associated protein 30 (CIA30) family protein [Aspergillus niger]
MAEAFEDSTKLAEDWLTYRTDQSTLDPNLGFVELFYQTCSAALVHLWRSHFRSTIRGSHRNTLKKDVANIDLWEEKFPIGHLDTILGRSQPLKLNVIENLKGIGNVLRPYFAIYDSSTHAGNGRDVAQDLGQELVTQLEKAVIILDEAASDSSSDDDSSDNSSESSESEYNRFGRLHCYVNCLMELVPVIERNISRLKKEEQSQHVPLQSEFRLSQDAQPFAMRIRDRFISASTLLVERLAEANLERSIRVRENEVDDEVLDALTLFKPYSQFCDSAIGTSLAPTSRYAATTASHTSFLWTNATKGSEHEAEIIDEISEDNDAQAVLKSGPEIFGVSHPSKRTPSKGSKSLSLENLPPIIKQFQFRCKEPGCKAPFKRQEHLRRHMKTHSKEKPHVCWVPGCHRAFGRSDSLNAHYTKTHSKRGGRNRYVATLDENSSDYNPEYRGQLTPDGRPICGSKLEDPNPDCGNLSVEGHLPVAEPETYEIPVGKNLLNTAKPPVSPKGGP